MGCGCKKPTKQQQIKAAQEQKKIEEARRLANSTEQPKPEPVSTSK